MSHESLETNRAATEWSPNILLTPPHSSSLLPILLGRHTEMGKNIHQYSDGLIWESMEMLHAAASDDDDDNDGFGNDNNDNDGGGRGNDDDCEYDVDNGKWLR